MLIGAGIGIPFQQNVLARLLGSAEFFAPLTHSAIPTRAAFGTTGTFTRATTSTWPNNDGYLVTGVAGEIGFVGARRVRNLLSATESVAAWTVQAGAAITDLGGGEFEVDVSGAALNTGVYIVTSGAPTLGRKWIGSIYIKAPSVTGDGTIRWYNPAQPEPIGGTSVTLTSDYQRANTGLVVAATGTGAGFWFKRETGRATLIRVKYPQIEDVTAQTTQTAGEYVSVGVESAPYYHGSMVDGVKCFPTDLSGNPIPSTTMLGYQAEGARTNYQPNSNAFTTTWSKTAGVTLTQNAIDDDGATTAWTAAITGAGQNITYGTTGVAANTICTLSMNMWPVDAGATRLAVYNTTGGAQFYADCNPITGTITTGTAGGTVTASGVIPIAGGGYRFWVAGSTGGTGAQTNNPVVYYGTDVDVKHSKIQFEIGSFASSYIPTTTIAVARNADVLAYSSAGNIDVTKGWAYAEVTYPNGAGLQKGAINTSNGAPLYISSTNKVSLYDGTSERFGTSFSVSANTQKIASTWGGAASSTANAGVVTATSGFDGDLSLVGSLEIGSNTGGSNSAFGIIRGIRIGQRLLSTSELQAITS